MRFAQGRDGKLYAVVESGEIVRDYPSQTAKYDRNVELEPGAYALEPMTVNFAPSDNDSAYWFKLRVPARLVRDDLPGMLGKSGDVVSWYAQPYGYAVREEIALWGR